MPAAWPFCNAAAAAPRLRHIQLSFGTGVYVTDFSTSRHPPYQFSPRLFCRFPPVVVWPVYSIVPDNAELRNAWSSCPSRQSRRLSLEETLPARATITRDLEQRGTGLEEALWLRMDYSHAAYFAGPPQQSAPYHQFPLGITPLTPSHSNSAGSEDFNNTSPPVSPPQ